MLSDSRSLSLFLSRSLILVFWDFLFELCMPGKTFVGTIYKLNVVVTYFVRTHPEDSFQTISSNILSNQFHNF